MPLVKGAIIVVGDIMDALQSIVFQYNPETLEREIKPRWVENAAKVEVSRLDGAPEETIKMDIHLTTDHSSKYDPIAPILGIYPQIYQLEMLLYPAFKDVAANQLKLKTGIMEIIPPSAPFTFFVWGDQRILPVKITGLIITEEEFDFILNPTKAKATVNMKVLSYNDLAASHKGFGVFMAHQQIMEAVSKAGMNSVF